MPFDPRLHGMDTVMWLHYGRFNAGGLGWMVTTNGRWSSGHISCCITGRIISAATQLSQKEITRFFLQPDRKGRLQYLYLYFIFRLLLLFFFFFLWDIFISSHRPFSYFYCTLKIKQLLILFYFIFCIFFPSIDAFLLKTPQNIGYIRSPIVILSFIFYGGDSVYKYMSAYSAMCGKLYMHSCGFIMHSLRGGCEKWPCCHYIF